MSKFCAKCGANIAPTAGFCPLCGFTANAKLPAAPEKSFVSQSSEKPVSQAMPQNQSKPQPQPQSQKSKKSPLGIIPIIIAAVMGIISIILLILLLIPDNSCDFCDKKATDKTKISDEIIINHCDDCHDKCTLCGKDATHPGKIASGKFVFMCDKCQNYIDSNMVAYTDETTTEPTDGFFVGEPDNNNVNVPEITKNPDTTQEHPNPESETTTKSSNNPSGDNNISNSATTAKPSTNSTSQSAKETTTKAPKINYETDGKLVYKNYEIKVNSFDSHNKNVTFKIANAADSEFKEGGIDIYYRTLDENKKQIDGERFVYVEFKDGKSSFECPLIIPDGTSTVQFFTKTKNSNA